MSKAELSNKTSLCKELIQSQFAHKSENVSISWVYDGDTVKLSDGRKIRLVGINTPELDHRYGKHQAYAKEATDYLKSLIFNNPKIQLHWAKDRRDKYGRGLAYLSLENGLDIQALLLAKGYAMSIIVEPNDERLSCYRSIELEAKTNKLGIWKLNKNKFIQAGEVNNGTKGYKFIKGIVTKVKLFKHTVLLSLSPSFDIYISDKKLARQSKSYWLGKTLLVRGWIKKYRGKPQIKLAHHLNLSYESVE